MADICRKWSQLEDFCNGCRNECDQKCIIDNHEVEILQAPVWELQPCGNEMSFCPSQRAGSLTDLCTPRQRVGYYTDSLATSAPNSFRTQLAHGIEGPQWVGRGLDHWSDRSQLSMHSSDRLGAGAKEPRTASRSAAPASGAGVRAV